MRGGFLLFLTIIFITSMVPQNNRYVDEITVIYDIQQVRYVSQKEKSEMKARDDTDVYITLQQSKEIALDHVSDSLLLKAESALEVGPKNICFIIDIRISSIIS